MTAVATRMPARVRFDRAVLHALVPCLVAVPALAIIVSTLVDLVTTSHPHIGYSQAIASDAKAVALGHSLYGDPAEQYTGMLYAPLFPTVVAPLYRLVWWDGWPAVVSLLSAISLASLVGVVAGTGGDRARGERWAGGIGVAAVAWWLVSRLAPNMLYDGRPDHFAWALALAGLVLLAREISRGGTRMWPIVLALSAALWAKQTTVGALVAVAVVLTVWAAHGMVPWAMWRRFAIGAVLVNVAVGAALWAMTDGWVRYFLLELPSRHQSDTAWMPYVTELAGLLLVPAALAGLVFVLLPRESRRLTASTFTMLLAVLLVAFVVASVGPAWLGRRKQGGHENQYIGIMWASGFIVALAHREAAKCRRALTADTIGYLLVALVAVPALVDEARPVDQVAPQVVAYARDHTVYLPDQGVLGERDVMPTQAAIADLLAAGASPGYLIDALQARRFDAVMPFVVGPDDIEYVEAAGLGSRDDLVALNELIRRGYAAGENGAPSPLLGRRGHAAS